MKNYTMEIMTINAAAKEVKNFEQSIVELKKLEKSLELMKPVITDKRTKEWKVYAKASEPITEWKKAVLKELPEKANLKEQVQMEIGSVKTQIRKDLLLLFRPRTRKSLLSQLERL